MTREINEIGSFSKEQILAVEAQVGRLVASSVLHYSPRQQQLLRYVVKASLAGQSERLKGYTLGIEVFQRPTDFDPNVDAIVRVEVGRLRSKLAEYYSREGVDDPVVIELPKGGNSVRINWRPPVMAAAPPKRQLQTAERPSIAVLPFASIANTMEQKYFADGITEDLIIDLSKLSALQVISRHSAFAYRASDKPAADIGAELGARYLLEGTVRCVGDTVRVTAQLIDSPTGNHVWADRYDRALRDIFTVQDDVVLGIVRALKITLTSLEDARQGLEGTASWSAYDLLLRGRERYWSYTPQSHAEALVFFRDALDLDPEFATAHAWLARSLLSQYANGWDGSDATTLETARGHARKAVEIDGLLPLAHAVLCWAELWAGKVDEAVIAGRRAVQLDPSDPDARVFLSVCQSTMGDGEEGLGHIEIAMRQNPHRSPFYCFARGLSLIVLERYADALADFEEGISLSVALPPNWMFAAYACIELGRMQDASRYAAALISLGDAPARTWRPLEQAPWSRRMVRALRRVGINFEE